MKKLLWGLLVFIVITWLCAFLILSYSRNYMNNSIPSKISKEAVLQDSTIINEIGQIIEIDENVGGHIENDIANISFEVKGAKKIVLVDCALVSKNGKWEVINIKTRK